MQKLTSPEKHLQSRDIQSSIRSYRGCPLLTNNGQTCRPSLITNRFADPSTGNKYDCNRYCMRECTSGQLLHIFKNFPTELITTTNKHFDIDAIILEFSTSKDHKLPAFGVTFVWQLYTKTGWLMTDARFYGDDSKSARDDVHGDANDMSRVLCAWFQGIPLNKRIKVKATIMSIEYRDALRKNDRIELIGFNTPYIRPVNNWEMEGTIKTEFELFESMSEMHALEPEIQSKAQPETEIDKQAILPVDIAEEPASLVYYGIAHPDIHHISRRHRQASHHRPRHFHSPQRKDRKSLRK